MLTQLDMYANHVKIINVNHILYCHQLIKYKISLIEIESHKISSILL